MQLVVKKTSWWEGWDAKQTAVLLPLAVAQVGALAAAGYLYNRVEQLEALADTLQIPNTAKSALAMPRLAASHGQQHVPPPPPPPQVTSVSPVLPVTLDSAITLNTMQVGQDFSHLISTSVSRPTQLQPELARVATLRTPSSTNLKQAGMGKKTPEKPVAASKKKPTRSLNASKSVIPATVAMATVRPDVDKTAEANLADLAALPLPEGAVREPVITATAENGVAPVTPTPQGRTTAPVGVSFWVYAGELRATGWHGPRLYHPIDSGLPEVGRRYRTQPIHGLYDAPHGKREMGGYQRGDVVLVEDVQYEPENNGAVWVKVTKIHSYGHTDR